MESINKEDIEVLIKKEDIKTVINKIQQTNMDEKARNQLTSEDIQTYKEYLTSNEMNLILITASSPANIREYVVDLLKDKLKNI